jgi:hypothetical protein
MFADSQIIVGHQRFLGKLMDAADAVAIRASTLGGVGREGFRIKQWLFRRVVTRARVQHSQQV